MKPAARALLLTLLLLAASGAIAAEGTTRLPKISPFSPAGGPAAPAAAANEAIEFSGVSTMEKKTDLIFRNKTSNKTSWIAKGETKDGIALLNYDEIKEQAVVKHNGVEKVLTLRKPGSAAGGVRPVAAVATGFNVPPPASAMPAGAPVAQPTGQAPLPVAPVAQPAGPQTEQQKQETEARMLVSDLLEIGMAQRKAYEEAQRKAAEGGGTTPPTTETPAKQP